MRHFHVHHLLAVFVIFLLASCEHDDPVNPIKPLDERRVLVLTHDGEIYDQNYELVTQLPYCTFASEIISEGNDYFVSGSHSKDRVGYWKNGKWNTLHVDFIDDVDHWTYGLGKWDYYIYLLDIPNVLKNSGIFKLEDCHDFIPDDHALAVSEGKCYVIGYAFSDNDPDGHYQPVLYTNYKKEYLPMPKDAKTGECHAIFAYDRDHTIIGGFIDDKPAVWVDKQYEIYPINYPREEVEPGFFYGRIQSVTKCNGHIYAAGFEHDNNNKMIATMWIDGVPEHYVSGKDFLSSQAVEIHAYGDDVYLFTSEYYDDDAEHEYVTYMWLNGKLIKAFPDLIAAGFTVL